MRLNELTGYRKHPFYELIKNSTSVYEFFENLKREGYREYIAGEGLYAGVLHRPQDDYVIKIFDSIDSGYETYLKFMIMFQKNPHVPKLRGKPIGFLNRYRIVRMEKLEPYDSDLDQEKFVNLIHFINSKNSNAPLSKQLKSYVKQYPDLVQMVDFLHSHRHKLDLHPGNVMYRLPSRTLVITDPLS
jgi:hypothetical protein